MVIERMPVQFDWSQHCRKNECRAKFDFERAGNSSAPENGGSSAYGAAYQHSPPDGIEPHGRPL
jgi:hypothetical protein